MFIWKKIFIYDYFSFKIKEYQTSILARKKLSTKKEKSDYTIILVQSIYALKSHIGKDRVYTP